MVGGDEMRIPRGFISKVHRHMDDGPEGRTVGEAIDYVAHRYDPKWETFVSALSDTEFKELEERIARCYN
jgi:hypothetical protein